MNGWYSNTLYSRLDNKNEDVIVIVMQRVHVDDLVGYVLDKDEWTVVSIPAIAPEAEEIRIGAHEVYRRAASEALQPAREDLASLEKTRLNIGSLIFASQFQQSPMPPGGNMIKRDWFNWYEAVEVLAFSGGKHDDQVDALSQFLHWVRRREQGPPQLRVDLYGFGGGSTVRDRYAERMGRSVFDGLF